MHCRRHQRLLRTHKILIFLDFQFISHLLLMGKPRDNTTKRREPEEDNLMAGHGD
jgi:hypothetical protein